MILAQISDSHVCPVGGLSNGRVDTNTLFDQAVRHLAGLTPVPDAVLFTGDLADMGRAEEYTVLAELLAPLAMPVYIIPGNHDDRDALRAAFPDHRYLPGEGPFLHYVIETHPLRLIGLDTLVPGEIHGEMCGARLDWLAARLEEAPERPTLVFMHHPPFETGLPMDRHMCRGGEAMGDIIARHPQVRRVVCGHVHRHVQIFWRGTIALTAPGTAHQVTLDLPPPGDSRGSTFNHEPPGFLLHMLRPDGNLLTHYAPCGVFPGPFPFYSGG